MRHVFEFRARFDVFAAHHDRQVPRLAAGEIEFVEHAAVLIDDGVGPEARPLDVVFLVVSELFRLLGAEVVAEKVHHTVAVADEIDGVAVPHGEKVHARGLRQFFVGILFQVKDGDGQAPAAAVALPGTEFLGSFEVRDLGAVWRKAGQACARYLQRLRRTALRRNEEELGVAARGCAEAVGTEQNIFAVGSPAGMKRQALGLAAFRGDDVDVRVAVILAGERDPFAVRRKLGIKFVAYVGSQPPCRSAFARSDP